MRKALVCVAGVVALGLAPAAHAVNFSTVFSETGQSMWSSGKAIVIDTGNKRIGPDPWNLGQTAGKFVNPCDPFGSCNTGAQIGAQTTGNMGLEYGLKFDSGSVNATYPINVHLGTPGVYSNNAGQAFTIDSSYTVPGFTGGPGPKTVLGLGQITAGMQSQGPTLQAYVNLDAQFHAFIGAQACAFGVCQGPFLGPLDVDKSQTLASINNNDGKIQIGGTVVSLDQNFSTLDGDLTARLNIPNINAASTKAAGSTATDLISVARDNIAALDANVGNIISKALGLPLVGDVAGIGYNLLSVNAGLALDVRQTLSLSIIPKMTLDFLSPVQQLLSNGTWGAATNSITYDLGQSVTLRSDYQNLAVIPITSLAATLTNRTDLLLEGDLSVQALGVNAFGFQIGPLLDTGNLNAGLLDIPIVQNSFGVDFGSVTNSPFSIAQLPKGASDTFKGFDLSYQASQTPGAQGQVYATDLDNTQCSPLQIGYGFCPDTKYVTSTGARGFDEQGQEVFIGDLGAFNQPGVTEGPNTGDDELKALLAGVGYTPGLPAFQIPVGAPAISVPEPGTWALMIAGLGLSGVGLRRRRARLA